MLFVLFCTLIFIVLLICFCASCRWWQRLLCFLFLIIVVYAGVWAIKNVIKYSSAEGINNMIIELRGEYLDIQSSLRKEPTLENAQQIQYWNSKVEKTYELAKIWGIRKTIDWREAVPISLRSGDIIALGQGKYRLEDYRIIRN